jgi:hypothetical protein
MARAIVQAAMMSIFVLVVFQPPESCDGFSFCFSVWTDYQPAGKRRKTSMMLANTIEVFKDLRSIGVKTRHAAAYSSRQVDWGSMHLRR